MNAPGFFGPDGAFERVTGLWFDFYMPYCASRRIGFTISSGQYTIGRVACVSGGIRGVGALSVTWRRPDWMRR